MIVGYQPPKSKDKFLIWHIEGGLGKNIAATSLIQDLSQKYADRKLILVVSYPEIFLNNPFVHRVYRVGSTQYFYDDFIRDKDTLIFRQEPYHQSGHITQNKHVIANWCDILSIEYKFQIPQFYPNAIQKTMVTAYNRQKPIMLIQTNGGGLNSNIGYSWTRDMPFHIAHAITEKYSQDYHIIQITKPNSQLIPNVEHITHQTSNFEQLSILAASQKRILIDSFLQHAAAGMGLPSTVLWIGTSPNNYGYKIHKNIVANEPKGSNKMIDSYIFEYQFDGAVHECPYNDLSEIFNINEILNSI
jgi:hypothetical protein